MKTPPEVLSAFYQLLDENTRLVLNMLENTPIKEKINKTHTRYIFPLVTIEFNTQTKEIEGVYSTTTHLQSEEQADTLVTT